MSPQDPIAERLRRSIGPVLLAGSVLLAGTVATACSPAGGHSTGDQRPTTTGRHLEVAWWEEVSVEAEDVTDGPVDERWLRVEVPADILFDFDSAALGDGGRASLGRIVIEHHLLDAREVVVAGATDSVGTLDYNLDLSRRRASSAADVLVEAGLDRSIIRIEAWADQHPVPVPSGVDRATADALQRRVEIRALLPSGTTDGARHAQNDRDTESGDER